MQNLATIVIERHGEEWHAQFPTVPALTRVAETPGEAMSSLLCLFSEIEFSQKEVSLVQERSTETHLEFTIPYRMLRTSDE